MIGANDGFAMSTPAIFDRRHPPYRMRVETGFAERALSWALPLNFARTRTRVALGARTRTVLPMEHERGTRAV